MLEQRPARLTEIAAKLRATGPEASRHVSRLGKAGLVVKASDGTYGLTPLGKWTTAILPSFQVLASRKEYFLSHDLSLLPMEYLRRIGELAEHRYLGHLDDFLAFVDETTKGATEYVWIMTDRPVRLEHHHPRPASVSLRCIAPRSFDKSVMSLLKQNWPGAGIELSYLDPVPAAVVLNEHVAGVLFPGLDGRIDFSQGLTGETASFRQWCRDLFRATEGRARRALL